MTTPAEVLSGALTRLANDRRRRITQYANLAPRPGVSAVPQRLLSDVGFLEAIQFSYINADPAHVTPPDDDDPRDVRQIVLCAYGLQLDAARFAARGAVVVEQAEGRDRAGQSMPAHPGGDAESIGVHDLVVLDVLVYFRPARIFEQGAQPLQRLLRVEQRRADLIRRISARASSGARSPVVRATFASGSVM